MTKLRNFWEETMRVLEENLERINVMWVGKRDGSYTMTFEEFEHYALQVNYDGGFGGHYIPLDFVVVGADWWLERGEYDGSEWWEFKRMPVAKVDAGKYDFPAVFNYVNDYKKLLSRDGLGTIQLE
jgi:hypothetical protein